MNDGSFFQEQCRMENKQRERGNASMQAARKGQVVVMNG